MIYITRKARFNAAHKLWNDKWNEKKNLEVFGPCSNPNWHGHNYILEITVAGDVNPDTGFVTDLRKLKEILDRKVLKKLDHKNLNLDVDFMKGVQPSTENLAMAIWKEIEPEIREGKLQEVKIYETENNTVIYRGE